MKRSQADQVRTDAISTELTAGVPAPDLDALVTTLRATGTNLLDAIQMIQEARPDARLAHSQVLLAWAEAALREAGPQPHPEDILNRTTLLDLLLRRLLNFDPELGNAAFMRCIGLRIPALLDLMEQPLLSGLPEGLKVKYGLYLNNCTGLTALPEGLEAGYGIVLAGCTSLKTLPKGLVVGGLTLNGCTSWDGIIPEDAVFKKQLIVEKDIYTDSYPAGIDVPEWRSLFQC